VSRPIATLDAWNGTDAPLALRSATGETLALLCDRAITDPRFERTVRAHSGSTLIAWSGHPESAPGDHPFARDPACWLPGALPAFLRRLEALEPLLAASSSCTALAVSRDAASRACRSRSRAMSASAWAASTSPLIRPPVKSGTLARTDTVQSVSIRSQRKTSSGKVIFA